MPSTKTTEQIRIDPEVKRVIQRKQKPRESYNDVLRRLLGVEAKNGARKS